MKSAPLQPAHLVFDDPDPTGTPHAPTWGYGDSARASTSAGPQADRVFLAGNGLPARWQGRRQFVVLETSFGLGHHFLATRAAWRADAQRSQRLIYIAIDPHPLHRADLARVHAHSPQPELAQQLIAQWPPHTPDLHTLDLDGGQVQLRLALGDAAIWLPELLAEVDAFYLDGFTPQRNPERNPELWDTRLLQGCARLAAPGATLATWHTTPALHAALRASGFAISPHSTPERLVAHWPAANAPNARPRSPLPGRQPAAQARSALVIGAGLAGAATARALAAQGVAVTVLERRDAPAQETSGNPAGLFHAVVHAHDGAHAQLLRAGTLRTAQLLRAPTENGDIPGSVQGLLRGAAGDDEADAAPDALAAMQQLIQRHALPANFVTALPQDAAQTLAGIPLAGAAWHYPGSGWVSPPALVKHWLAQPGIALRTDADVARLTPLPGGGWQALDAADQPIAQADVVVLACAHSLVPLLAEHTDATDWPLGRSRGQVTWWPPERAAATGLPRPHLPLASGGYLIAPPDGSLLCGATNQPRDDDSATREADHRANLQRLVDLTGQPVDTDAALAAQPLGRVGWRLMCDDRLPLVGPVPQPWSALHGLRRLEQARQVPRIPGLYALSALGSRGLSVAPLLGEALAAWITGTPQPLAASLLDAVDVARFVTRRVRKGEKPA